MPLRIYRPTELPGEDRAFLSGYLSDQISRSLKARKEQVDDDYVRWQNVYSAIPRQKTRITPWLNASNIAVPLVRMFLDTAVARSLNVIFATRPVLTIRDLPKDMQEVLERYANYKVATSWKYYDLVRDMLHCGNKNGTAVTKTYWRDEKVWGVREGAGGVEEGYRIDTKDSSTEAVPFEDFGVFPITTRDISRLELVWHRIRYTEEQARQLAETQEWYITPEDVSRYAAYPKDVKRRDEEEEAKVYDRHLKEVHIYECYFKHAVSEDKSALYECVGSIIATPSNTTEIDGKLADLYYNPHPNVDRGFRVYRPYPRETMFFGESMCGILEQLQEETSKIHNDRRNNSFLANAPVFKKKAAALVPNSSTNWWPGMVFEVDQMDDLDVLTVGRNNVETISEEQHVMQLCERVLGIGSAQQGYGQGMMGKRGIYNASGTMAIMAEGNQRQNTYIRDIRSVVGDIGKFQLALQLHAQGADDPALAMLDEEFPAKMQAFMQQIGPDKIQFTSIRLEASNAAVNAETRKQNLLAMVGILEKYGAQAMQIGPLLVNPELNPAMRAIINGIVDMHKAAAQQIVSAFEEYDLEGEIPDVRAIIESTVPGANPEANGQGQPGGIQEEVQSPELAGPQGPINGEQVRSIAQMANGGLG